MEKWLESADQLEGLRNRLHSTWNQVFHPGACDRAAEEVLEMIQSRIIRKAG